MTYELWDFDTGNATGSYPSLLAALQVVKGACDRDGEATLDGLALIEVHPDGERRLVAQERGLAPLVGIKVAEPVSG
ncbi:MAG TPA: hypothetical protein VF998_04645 [Candidatus Limnocylindria bacterium]